MMDDGGIHIIAGGLEYDRIIAPILHRYSVKKLIILKGETEERYPKANELANHFINKWTENPLEYEIKPVNIYDFEEIFRATVSIIEEASQEGRPIYLNISSAPKLTLVGMLSAALLLRDTVDIQMFYVAPKEYIQSDVFYQLKMLDEENKEQVLENFFKLKERFLQSGIGEGAKDYIEIPLFPIQTISTLDREIMNVLKDHETIDSIKELVDTLNEERTANKQEKVERSSVQYRLDKLESKGLIRTNRVKRRKRIDLTSAGSLYLVRYEAKQAEHG